MVYNRPLTISLCSRCLSHTWLLSVPQPHWECPPQGSHASSSHHPDHFAQIPARLAALWFTLKCNISSQTWACALVLPLPTTPNTMAYFSVFVVPFQIILLLLYFWVSNIFYEHVSTIWIRTLPFLFISLAPVPRSWHIVVNGTGLHWINVRVDKCMNEWMIRPWSYS